MAAGDLGVRWVIAGVSSGDLEPLEALRVAGTQTTRCGEPDARHPTLDLDAIEPRSRCLQGNAVDARLGGECQAAGDFLLVSRVDVVGIPQVTRRDEDAVWFVRGQLLGFAQQRPIGAAAIPRQLDAEEGQRPPWQTCSSDRG